MRYYHEDGESLILEAVQTCENLIQNGQSYSRKKDTQERLESIRTGMLGSQILLLEFGTPGAHEADLHLMQQYQPKYQDKSVFVETHLDLVNLIRKLSADDNATIQSIRSGSIILRLSFSNPQAKVRLATELEKNPHIARQFNIGSFMDLTDGSIEAYDEHNELRLYDSPKLETVERQATPDYQPIYANSYALIIGIDNYPNEGFYPLGRAEDDAVALANILGRPPYDFSVKTLLGEQATKYAIQETLFALQETQPNDRVIIYFAGHGYMRRDRRGNEIGYLAAADTIPQKDFTALRMDELTDLRNHSQAKHIGFIFDACFSGQALGLTALRSYPKEDAYLTMRAYQAISAASGNQGSRDSLSMTQSLVAMLDEPKGKAVTLNELGFYIKQQITRTRSGAKK